MNKGVLESQGNNTLLIFRFGWKQKKYCSKHGMSVNAGIAAHVQHVTTHQSRSIQGSTVLSKSYAECMSYHGVHRNQKQHSISGATDIMWQGLLELREVYMNK